MTQLHRTPGGPLLTRADVRSCGPSIEDPSAVFNPGAVFWRGQVHLMLRVQTRGRETFLVMARSEDGTVFEVASAPVALTALQAQPERVFHAYDPRLTVLEGAVHALVALDYDDRTGLGLLRSRDLDSWEFLGDVSTEDTRNGVLFPDKIGGRYVRLERPNRIQPAGGPRGGDEIWLATSSDLLSWRLEGAVARGRPHFWDELIGPGPPPIKTRDGWLLLYHGIATHFGAANIYQAGAMLLDLQDPSKVLARTRNNILEPREDWEMRGQVPNVVFPTGLVVTGVDGAGADEGEGDRAGGEAARGDVAGGGVAGVGAAGVIHGESPFLLYYGAADTVVGLAMGKVADLVRACRED